ncbi:hypothetical protein, partial [Arcanobacterium phocae]|uniref:hypothetical protein n=1 Tax=Arcanobacterium phocae TaxID=131112 RepID=UPI001C12895A
MGPSQPTLRGQAPGHGRGPRSARDGRTPRVIHVTLASTSRPEQEPHVRHVHTSARTRTLGPC